MRSCSGCVDVELPAIHISCQALGPCIFWLFCCDWHYFGFVYADWESGIIIVTGDCRTYFLLGWHGCLFSLL